jgi:hypothetical protein
VDGHSKAPELIHEMASLHYSSALFRFYLLSLLASYGLDKGLSAHSERVFVDALHLKSNWFEASYK